MTNRIIFIVLIVFLFSCHKEKLPIYPIEPHIEFKSAEFTEELDQLMNHIISLNIIFDYTDGDSNLGGNHLNGDESEYDCILTLYEKVDDSYTLMDLMFNPIYYNFPEIGNQVLDYYPIKVRPRNIVEGEIETKLQFISSFVQKKVNGIFKITIQVLDRDHNLSNIIEFEGVWPYFDETN